MLSPTQDARPKSKFSIADEPHQFGTRNDLIKRNEREQSRTKNAAKSTKLLDILPLITVWLQIRVLPGQGDRSLHRHG